MHAYASLPHFHLSWACLRSLLLADRIVLFLLCCQLLQQQCEISLGDLECALVYYILIRLLASVLGHVFYLFFLRALDFLFFRTNVATFLGLPPGLPAALLRLIAERFCAFVIRAALAAGTHLGYLPFFEVFRPQGLYPPPFLGREISTQFSLNHLVSPPLGLRAINLEVYTYPRPTSKHLQLPFQS